MRYNLNGETPDRWENKPFDTLGEAVSAAMDGLNAGWLSVTIECPENTILHEKVIRDIHQEIEIRGFRV